MEMHLIICGHGAMIVNDESIPVFEDSLIVTFPEDVHHLVTAPDCAYMAQYIVFFNGVNKSETFGIKLRKHFHRGLKCPQAAAEIGKIEHLWKSGNESLTVAAEYRFNTLILELLEASSVSVSNASINKALDYMRFHIDKKISLDELSRYVGLEKAYFCRLFKRVCGESPLRFFMRQKIELTKEMLIAGKLHADIAASAGFVDEFHFSRCFKKITGMSPRKYRESGLINKPE
jgi:AraC-like DNA-binding protein